MTTLQEIGNARYIALESYKRSGEAKVTPVWVTYEEGRLYVTTGDGAWKTKRILRNSAVRVAASNARGRPHSAWVSAQGRVLTDAASLAQQENRGRAKYGWQFRLYMLVSRLLKHPNVVIEIYPGE